MNIFKTFHRIYYDTYKLNYDKYKLNDGAIKGYHFATFLLTPVGTHTFLFGIILYIIYIDRSPNLHNRGHQFLNININNLYINNSGRKRNIQKS